MSTLVYEVDYLDPIELYDELVILLGVSGEKWNLETIGSSAPYKVNVIVIDEELDTSGIDAVISAHNTEEANISRAAKAEAMSILAELDNKLTRSQEDILSLMNLTPDDLSDEDYSNLKANWQTKLDARAIITGEEE